MSEAGRWGRTGLKACPYGGREVTLFVGADLQVGAAPGNNDGTHERGETDA